MSQRGASLAYVRGWGLSLGRIHHRPACPAASGCDMSASIYPVYIESRIYRIKAAGFFVKWGSWEWSDHKTCAFICDQTKITIFFHTYGYFLMYKRSSVPIPYTFLALKLGTPGQTRQVSRLDYFRFLSQTSFQPKSRMQSYNGTLDLLPE